MLDYFGSITIDKNDIIKSIIKHYNNKYNNNYIINILNYLYSKQILEKEYSVSGWNMWYCSITLNHVKNYITLDTLNKKKIVALMFQLINSSDLVFEPNIYKKICDNVCVKYYG
mgnify:CR=1 FL=1|tara:strand:+ start:417 stop:758 length:342 start_codon:yes stop_codon:yes gene_type:complete